MVRYGFHIEPRVVFGARGSRERSPSDLWGKVAYREFRGNECLAVAEIEDFRKPAHEKLILVGGRDGEGAGFRGSRFRRLQEKINESYCRLFERLPKRRPSCLNPHVGRVLQYRVAFVSFGKKLRAAVRRKNRGGAARRSRESSADPAGNRSSSPYERGLSDGGIEGDLEADAVPETVQFELLRHEGYGAEIVSRFEIGFEEQSERKPEAVFHIDEKELPAAAVVLAQSEE